MKQPKTLKNEIVLDEFLKVKKERLRFENGYEHNHYTLSLPTETSVSIIAATEDKRLIINEEYRHPAGKAVLSLPGGFLDGDETPEKGGQRELLEETGYEASNVAEIGRSYPMPGICDQQVIYILAGNCRKIQEPELEGGEIINTLVLSSDELNKIVSEGAPVDGILLAGLWFYQHWSNR
jgi:ADP-ribose pyrophosphatase